jgi:hypothetical protein
MPKLILLSPCNACMLKPEDTKKKDKRKTEDKKKLT